MNLDATAEALVANEATSEATPEVTSDAPSEAQTEDQALDAIWDKHNAEETDAPADAEAPEEAPEAEAPKVEAPSDLPKAVRDSWGEIPEGARDAFVTSQREMAARLADQGRLMQGIAPIRDVLTDAIKDMPQLAGMKPEDVAKQTMHLARLSAQFGSDPVGGIMELAKQHGVQQELAHALGGEGNQEQVDLLREVSALKQELARVSNPDYLRQQVSAVTTEAQTMSAVQQFSQGVENWAAAEPHMPLAIPFAKAKLGDGASPQDVLREAYNLVESQFLQTKAPEPLAAEAKVEPDPEKAQAAEKAKSINVTNASAGKKREMTEDEILSAAYDRAQRK